MAIAQLSTSSPKLFLYDSDHNGIHYPQSDGQPMAESSMQYDYLTMTKGNLDILYADNPNVMVAGDLFWYPVEGNNKIRLAPDVMVALGRPKAHRRSYQQWREENVAPQIVFEILSAGNRAKEMADKFEFYERYGVEEYYIYDPQKGTLEGWQRTGRRLLPIEDMIGWTSQRLKIRFDMAAKDLLLYYPDGRPFLTFTELDQRREQAEIQVHEETLARLDAEEKAQSEAEARVQAEEQARVEAEARTKAEEQVRAEAKARAQAEEQARAEAEARAQAEEQTRVEAAARAQAEAQIRELAEKLRQAGLQ